MYHPDIPPLVAGAATFSRKQGTMGESHDGACHSSGAF